MSYKLIALDLDGTLCNDEKAVTPRTADALKQAQEHGILVALASARGQCRFTDFSGKCTPLTVTNTTEF